MGKLTIPNLIQKSKDILVNIRNRPRVRVSGFKNKSISIYTFNGGLYRYELNGNFVFNKSKTSDDVYAVTIKNGSDTQAIEVGKEAQADRLIKKIRRSLDPLYMKALRAFLIVFGAIVIMNMINGDFWAPSTLENASTEAVATQASVAEPAKEAIQSAPEDNVQANTAATNEDFGLPEAPFAD